MLRIFLLSDPPVIIESSFLYRCTMQRYVVPRDLGATYHIVSAGLSAGSIRMWFVRNNIVVVLVARLILFAYIFIEQNSI